MLYENLIPLYVPYEDPVLRQLNSLHAHAYPPARAQNSCAYPARRKEYGSSASLIKSSLLNHSSLSSSSPSFFPPAVAGSKKVTSSELDALSFCHTIYITVKKNPNSLSCSSSASSLNCAPHAPGDSQLLVLPDICCTIPASKSSD